MAAIIWNMGEENLINTWLVGSSSYTSTVVGAPGTSIGAPTVSSGNWGLGMGSGTQPAASTASKGFVNGTVQGSTIAEIAQTNAVSANYFRQPINRSGNGLSGWPLSANAGGSWASSAPQQTFSFGSQAPVLNGANVWFVALTSGPSSVGARDCMFGADLSSVRTFGPSDTERITVTYKQT